ncbi:hypothetical protein G6F40_013175 [Rhizopus arrhizus]|nr:hypothetical protein G6F40_013175 [Rhizopus arrhizus]
MLSPCALSRFGSMAISTSFGGAPVGGTGQAHLQDRLVAAGPLEHVVALQVVGQVAADRIDALAGIGGGDGDITVPVAELDVDQRRFGGRRRAHALDPGHRRQRFLDRADDGPLHFLRGRTGVRDLHEQERCGDVRQRFQRQPERSDQADHHQRHEAHDGGDRTADGELGNAHAGSSAPAALPAAPCSISPACLRPRSR